jgi:multidrug efflux pump subunit AcrA (membrane-fusion protein)
MADEEFERYQNFILEQQAQSVVKIAQIEAAQARFAEDLSRLTDNVGQLAANTRLLAEGTLARFNDLAEGTLARFSDVDERISALVDAQIKTEAEVKETTEALRRFIARLDRQSEGRDGKAEQ